MKKKAQIINIGRQFGSGGRQVAHELGQLLGYPVYDNELITKAAEASGFSEQLFAGKDEKRSLFSISAFFSSGRYSMSPDNYDVIRKIASEGPAIFIGRCSDYILRDREDSLDIFISAPLEDRIKRVCQRMEVSEEEARSIIQRRDKTRQTYYNYFTFGDWGVASNYDLCIDSSIMGIEKTAGYIANFIEGMAE